MDAIAPVISTARLATVAPKQATAPQTANATANTSGSWTIVPGLLTVNWKFDPANETVEISADCLWWTIETLQGQLSATQLSIGDNISILGLVDGSLNLSAVFQQASGSNASSNANVPARTPGLWINGDLNVFGNDWTFDTKLLAW